MPRQSPILLPRLSQPIKSSKLEFTSLLHFNFENTYFNRDRPQDLYVEATGVKPYTDGRWSTGKSKTKHKHSFLGGSTSQSSYGGNIVQELRDRYSPYSYHLAMGSYSHRNPFDMYPSLGSQHHMWNYMMNIYLSEVITYFLSSSLATKLSPF